MYLSKVQIKNYKSFLDSGEINFKPGINIIVGTNNSGKTSMLEALFLKISNEPHLSIKTKSTKTSLNLSDITKSSVIVYFSFSSNDIYTEFELAEIYELLKMSNETNLEISTPLAGYELLAGGEYLGDSNVNLPHTYASINGIPISEYPDKILQLKDEDPTRFYMYSNFAGHTKQLYMQASSNIYRFQAERRIPTQCPYGHNKVLNSDASNLAEVLHKSQSKQPDTFEEYNKRISEILPSIKWVTTYAENVDASVISEIRIWNIEKSSRRDDLALLLSKCGTGVGQILAILYVVIFSENPQIIIIDEPQSFLHPKASKKLIDILNEYPQHQYFISTHSPEILSAANPSTINYLQLVDGQTKVQSLNLQQTKEMREVLEDIGVKFSDVFFAENILWVEGETEENAFPLLFQKEKELSAITFLPVGKYIGNLSGKNKKNAEHLFDIYNKLSGAHALVPPTVGMILDKEQTDKQRRKELKLLSNGMLKFLPRRMFENYLLDAEAMTYVINQELDSSSEKISLNEVKDWLENKETSKEYFDKQNSLMDKESVWRDHVDAAKLLEELFRTKDIEFRKTKHSVALTKWLIEIKPEFLHPIKTFLLDVINPKLH